MLNYIEMLRANLYAMSRGNIRDEIRQTGFVADCMRELQANLRVSEDRWRLAVACTLDGVWDIDLIGGKSYFSSRFWEMLRFPVIEAEIEFRPDLWGSFVHPDDREKWNELTSMTRDKNTAGNERRYLELRVRGGDGKYRWIGLHHMLIMDEDGRPCRYIGVCSDIQERREQEDAIRRQATHDQLTGLPNRYLYNDRLLQQMVMTRRNDASLILVMWDLDGFKFVNDTYGHLAGDQLLISVAETMRACLRETDTLARFGGDEFVMLLSSARGCEEDVAAQATDRIFEAFKTPVDIGGGESVMVGASCGAAFFPEHSSHGEELLDFADKALYLAKHTGKNQMRVWTPQQYTKT
jgi:diguanylate cyclase (GGDEF)-like protein/PAS domain S-box-containing protein